MLLWCGGQLAGFRSWAADARPILSVHPSPLVWNQKKVNCGNRKVTLALGPGLVCSSPPQAQGITWWRWGPVPRTATAYAPNYYNCFYIPFNNNWSIHQKVVCEMSCWTWAFPCRPHSEVKEVGMGDRVLSVQVCRSSPGLVATHAAPHTVRVTHLHSNKVPIAAHLKVSVRGYTSERWSQVVHINTTWFNAERSIFVLD